MTKLVAIVGATGLQGGSVLKTLYASGKYKIRALTRSKSSDKATALAEKYPGIELAEADLDNVESLRQAFSGADIVFGMTDMSSVMTRVLSGEVDVEFIQGKNIVDAAIDAGVKTAVYSSLDSLSKQSSGKYDKVHQFESKNQAGEYLLSKSDKIDGFVICLGCYMNNFLGRARISPDEKQTVEFHFPFAPTTRIPLVDTANDTGPVVEYILEHPDKCRGIINEVSGGLYEAQEMAKAFTEATGKPACYVQTPFEDIPLEEVKQMFQCIEEFGPFSGRTGFVERNKKLSYKFTTPVEFFRNNGWTGPL
ncbi:hypothetical protein IWW50_002231 [Coemansia erecta]|nr:hypothetical protein GGF43_001823 [Coemansia sp. RSA 2618]KAJ2826718.1 hypothetical protein IWW50_002231 [Coemansia erecta]